MSITNYFDSKIKVSSRRVERAPNRRGLHSGSFQFTGLVSLSQRTTFWTIVGIRSIRTKQRERYFGVTRVIPVSTFNWLSDEKVEVIKDYRDLNYRILRV